MKGSVKPELTLRVPKKTLNVNSALDSRDSKYSIRRIRNIQLAVCDTQVNFVWLRANTHSSCFNYRLDIFIKEVTHSFFGITS